MSATIQIHEMSALTTGTDKTSSTVRFKAADNSTVDTVNPLQVPASGSIYSYSKKIRAKMTVAPNTQVSNFQWYTNGANGLGTGIDITVKNLGNTWGANYNTAMSGGADLFTKTSGSPLQGDVTNTGPFLPAANGTYIADLLELQMSVASTAANGALTPQTLTLAYSEI